MRQRRIVCAAIRMGDCIIPGARHYDMIMHGLLKRLSEQHVLPQGERVSGFIDNFGAFVEREEALEIANAAGQVIEKSGNPNDPRLYSEDLY